MKSGMRQATDQDLIIITVINIYYWNFSSETFLMGLFIIVSIIILLLYFNVYLVVLYKKYSLPVSAFILTIIAVAVSSMKRRGGMGINLAIGILLAFAFVFLDKVFGVLAEKSSASPIIAVWIPNIVFGILALVLLRNAKR